MKNCVQKTEVKICNGRTLLLKQRDVIPLLPEVSHYDKELFSEPQTYKFYRFLDKSMEM